MRWIWRRVSRAVRWFVSEIIIEWLWDNAVGRVAAVTGLVRLVLEYIPWHTWAVAVFCGLFVIVHSRWPVGRRRRDGLNTYQIDNGELVQNTVTVRGDRLDEDDYHITVYRKNERVARFPREKNTRWWVSDSESD